MIQILGGLFLGWGLGANDSANVFGTAVSSRMVKYSTAIILSALFIMLGALLEGEKGMETISSLSSQNNTGAIITSIAAAITVIVLTFLKLPISTSQAVVGAILGSKTFELLYRNGDPINFEKLRTVIICWFATPIGGFIFTVLFYYLMRFILQKMQLNMIKTDMLIRAGLIVAGCYGAYALGANNVANVTGVFHGNILQIMSFSLFGMEIRVSEAVLYGGISIALGVLTFSKNVMLTVGKGIVPLDGFSALVTVIAHAVTVHIFAMIGVPVSTSQAIVGAVIGIGLIKNMDAINYSAIIKVFSGWFVTPLGAFTISFSLTYLSFLRLDV